MSLARAHLAALFAGVMFGLGVAVSQMINPEKVLNFLDVSGDWDPSLLLVMGVGVAVTVIAFRFVLRARQPLLSPVFHLPTRQDIDRELVLGAALFGLGWGMAGYCPGPALAALTTLRLEPVLFVAFMLVGSEVRRLTA